MVTGPSTVPNDGERVTEFRKKDIPSSHVHPTKRKGCRYYDSFRERFRTTGVEKEDSWTGSRPLLGHKPTLETSHTLRDRRDRSLQDTTVYPSGNRKWSYLCKMDLRRAVDVPDRREGGPGTEFTRPRTEDGETPSRVEPTHFDPRT